MNRTPVGSRSWSRILAVGATAALLLLSACGGGGGSTAVATAPPPPTQGTISGSAIKGPVGGASITAYALTNGAMGSPIGTAATDAQGAFSMSVGTYAGPVLLQMVGGSYTDEATGSTMAMASGDVMTAVLPSMAAGSAITHVQLTPLTSMAQGMATHLAGGMTDANIATANTAVGTYFMVSDILHTMPMNPLVSGAGGSSTQDATNYGFALAAMSEYAQAQGMTTSSAIVTAMMNDAADGVMDGKSFGTAIPMGGMGMSAMMPTSAATTGLGAAMGAFITSSHNQSGVVTSTMQSLMTHLNGSSGQMIAGGATGSSGNNGTLSGTAFNGPMSHATVTAYAITSGMKGAQLASTTTDGAGAFSISVGNYAGPVMLQVSGGSYTDEATGTTMIPSAADVMTASMASIGPNANLTGIWITPLSSMAQSRAAGMAGHMTDANIAAANAAVGTYFIVADILMTAPMNPDVAGSGASATTDQRNSGMAIAAMSQTAKGLGMSVSADVVAAMASDASDGMMDGKAGATQIQMGGGMMGGGGMMQVNAGTSGLATAMTTFLASPANMSGLSATDMNALIQKLAAASGQL